MIIEDGLELKLVPDRVKRRKKELFIEWHTVSRDGEKQEFFGHLGSGFFILDVPYSPEGLWVSGLFMARLGPPSREPVSKCGGGCSGDGAGSGLLTVYTWEYPPAEDGSVRRMVADILGTKGEEWL